MSERLVKSTAWRGLVEKPTAFVPFTVVRTLEAADIDDLLELFARGSEAERRVAVGILRDLARRGSEIPEVPWTDATRATLSSLVAAKTRDYFAGRLPWTDAPGATTRLLWLTLDPHGLLSFLGAQALETLPASAQEEAIKLLAALARDLPAAREKLEATADAQGDLAIRIRDALEWVGIVTQERLDYWGRRWRDSKDPDALDWLYDRWLSFLPVGCPVSQLLAVLGPADDGELPDLYFTSAHGHVYVEAYEKTGFAGCHRT